MATLSRNTREIESSCEQLKSTGGLVSAGPYLVEAVWWKALQQKAAAHIDSEHKAHPERNGLAIASLRQLLPELEPHPDLLDPFVNQLCADGFQQSNGLIRRQQHKQALPPQLSAAGEKIRAILLATPLDPPNRKIVAPDPDSRQALRFLIDTHEVVDLGPDLVIAAAPYRQAGQIVRNFLQARGRATTSELRQHLGVSRRIVIPLLEKFDKDGTTRREGDTRVLRT